MNNIIIKSENISKKYRLFRSRFDRIREAISPFGKKFHNEYWALNNISFEIRKGEVIGILGKNGSGKSTLLQIICSIKNPSKGNIEVHGNIASILELGIDFNPQLSGRDNIILRGIMNGCNEEDIKNKLPGIMDFASIGDYIDQPVGTYSSGMLVRVAFASCISLQPDIFIVDEALSVGDLEFQIKCINWMKEYVNKGGTLIFVSHDMQLLTSLCEKVLLLDEGEMVAFDKTQICTEMYIKNINNKNIEEDKEYYVNKTERFDSLIAYGDVRANIKTITTSDASMRVTDNYSYNDYCNISITAEIDEKHSDAYMLILLRDGRGYNIYGKWLPIKTLEKIESENNYLIVCCKLKLKLALATGSYGITVSVNKKQMHITTNIIERHVAARYISVSDAPEFLHGTVNLE